MRAARIQVAYGGMHPDRVRGLYERFGPAGTLRRLQAGAIETTDRVRRAVSVPAERRLAELSSAGIGLLLRGDAALKVERVIGIGPDVIVQNTGVTGQMR